MMLLFRRNIVSSNTFGSRVFASTVANVQPTEISKSPRQPTPYSNFRAQSKAIFKAANLGLNSGELNKVMFAHWKTLSPKQMLVYQQIQPKVKTSAYTNFMVQTRGAIKSANPTLSFGEISKALGAQWKALSPEQQSVYKPQEPEVKPEVKPEVVPKTPSRPLSGYMNFMVQTRAAFKSANPTLSFGEISKALGAQWKALSPEQQSVYKPQEPEVKPEVVPKTPSRPLSGYMNFMVQTRAAFKSANPTLSFGEISKALGAQWKALSPEQQSVFKPQEPEVKPEMKPEVVPKTPSRPHSAYTNFMVQTRAAFKSANPTLSFGEISKALGAQWKALSPEQQSVFKSKEPEVKPEVVPN